MHPTNEQNSNYNFFILNIEDKIKHLIMTHRGNPNLLFLTVEAWAGAYPFR